MIPNVPAETQLTIIRLEIERNIEFIKKNLNKATPEEEEVLNEFLKDAEELDLLLSEYESRDGRFKKIKRVKTIVKLTKKVAGLKIKYRKLNPILNKIGEKGGFYDG